MISFYQTIMTASSFATFLVLFGQHVVLALANPSATTTTTTASSSSSVWGHVAAGPPDAILGIAQAFRESTHADKVNVCVGAYRDEQGKPWVLSVVRKAEELMLASPTDNKEYLPIEGDDAFVQQALQFAYGAELLNDPNIQMAGVQTLSGTGACRIGGEFLARHYPASQNIYIPNPTWGNHFKIFQECGLTTHTYRYYGRTSNNLDLDGMIQDLQRAPDRSIILLHACAHNPTGCDPTLEQWKEIANVVRAKRHLVFFDSAYQGFASGDAEQDATALRFFLAQPDIPLLLAQSFAKNFGLYGERCGTLSVKCHSRDEQDRVLSQLKLIIRPMYSSPPRHGSSIVKTVLNDADLTAQYHDECALMARRIGDMRTRLVEALYKVGSKHDWSHVTSQIGMFAFTGMSAPMCDELTNTYSIYLTRDGRISLAGLNEGNLEYVAKAIHAVTDGKSITGGDE